MIDALIAAPVLVKVVGSLALILVVNRFARNLVASVAAGTLALGFWTGQSGGGDESVDAWGKRQRVPLKPQPPRKPEKHATVLTGSLPVV